MPESDLETIHKHIFTKLQGLKPALTYHSIDHTLDVMEQSTRIALDEGINEKELYLLKVAALYHDVGFLDIYKGHEKRGCEIFLADSDELFHFSQSDKDIIIGLIMATKVPQRPANLLQKIICDADLDYLGRNDFNKIAARLKNEFLSYDIVSNDDEWHEMQAKFLNLHQYHTKSSRLLREPVKKANIERIGEW